MFLFYFILMLIILEWVREILKMIFGSLFKVWYLNIVWFFYFISYWWVLYKSIERKRCYYLKLFGYFFFYNLNECIVFLCWKLECWVNYNGSKGGLLKCMVLYNLVGNWCFKVVKILDEIIYCLKVILKSDINCIVVDWD